MKYRRKSTGPKEVIKVIMDENSSTRDRNLHSRNSTNPKKSKPKQIHTKTHHN